MSASLTHSTTPDQPTQSARQRLIDWANHQDGWVRSIVAEVTATRRGLSPEALAQVRDAYFVEKQLAPGEIREVPPLPSDGTADDATDPLCLTELCNCAGVNALASGQTIAFNPRMTVLFGENAAGKTGYVRVLKLLANVRSAEAIIPDVHRPSSPTEPHAVVRYTLGVNSNELEWHGEKGVSPFTRLTVFDSPAVALHLEDNVTYVYTPSDLALFRYVHAAIEGVRALLQVSMSERTPKQNPFLTAFPRGTEIYPRIEALSGSTSMPELESLAAVTETEKTELESLKVSIAALSSSSPGGQTDMLRNRATILSNLMTIGTAYSQFNSAGFMAAVESEKSARAAQTTSAAAVFGGGQLPEELRPTWQRFLEAGEQYLAISGRVNYPKSDDDVCIYCRQKLDDAARSLLTAYRDYASGATAAAVRVAAAQLTAHQAPITSPALTATLEGLRATLPALLDSEQVPDWAADGQLLTSAVEVAYEAALARKKPSAQSSPQLPESLLPRLRVALDEADAAIKGLQGDAAQRTQLLAQYRAKVALVEARLKLAQLLPDIRTYVESAAWVSSLRTLLGRFQGLLTGLTLASKLASEDVLNRDFERFFYAECLALRAPTVTLDFPGRKGEAARRKTVSHDHSLAEILCEGEQKVIAIADFLAEAALRTGSAPVVFDDPVNSLDHRRVVEIASRVAALSAEHQVIVFTHDIWFTTELLAAFDDNPSACSCYQIREEGGVKGLISGEKHPRSDTVSSIAKRINTRIQDAAGGADDGRQERIDAAYDLIRTWCERVVEHDLLKKVAQRFQPNVAMQNLVSIKTERLGLAIATIYPIWEKACRYMTGHSQPMETLGIRPSLDELRQDWDTLQRALKDYQAS